MRQRRGIGNRAIAGEPASYTRRAGRRPHWHHGTDLRGAP